MPDFLARFSNCPVPQNSAFDVTVAGRTFNMRPLAMPAMRFEMRGAKLHTVDAVITPSNSHPYIT
jgi:hypothetical protein